MLSSPCEKPNCWAFYHTITCIVPAEGDRRATVAKATAHRQKVINSLAPRHVTFGRNTAIAVICRAGTQKPSGARWYAKESARAGEGVFEVMLYGVGPRNIIIFVHAMGPRDQKK